MIRLPFLKPRGPAVASLYGDIVATARKPLVYRDFGVVDDFEGRFEYLTLVATLVLRRLRELGAAAEPAGQELVDHLFADLDNGLRLAGTGDLSVGKKMKKMAQGFYGRAGAYTAALEKGEAADRESALREALARNLFGNRLAPEVVAPGLLAEVDALCARLKPASLEALLGGKVLSGEEPSARKP